MGVNGQSPLHVADSLDIVNLLLKTGFDVNNKNYLGRTPLMSAIARGNVDIADSLVSAGASLTEIDFMGRSALHFADLFQNRQKGISNKLSQFLIDRGALRAMAQCGVAVPRPPRRTEIHQDSFKCVLEEVEWLSSVVRRRSHVALEGSRFFTAANARAPVPASDSRLRPGLEVGDSACTRGG